MKSARIVSQVWLICRISESHGNGALRMIIPDLVVQALQFLPSSVSPVLRGTADKVTFAPLLAIIQSKCFGTFWIIDPLFCMRHESNFDSVYASAVSLAVLKVHHWIYCLTHFVSTLVRQMWFYSNVKYSPYTGFTTRFCNGPLIPLLKTRSCSKVKHASLSRVLYVALEVMLTSSSHSRNTRLSFEAANKVVKGICQFGISHIYQFCNVRRL